METQRIRRSFLDYFKKQKHAVIPSSPVIPHDDPTLLFTNAGMNQFKDVFLGHSVRDYQRATTSQKCIRVGGKHNDLDNVGHTRRHLTFFEMVGNFSFGDYFKEEAIRFAWEVSTQVFSLDGDRIWPSVFRDDEEAYELWKKFVPERRIVRFGEAENFWSMGETGPCGPSSELLYDRGSHYGSSQSPMEDTTGERYLEFWNLVFMQYNRHPGGSMESLPKPSIDTGAGLERIVSLRMDVDNVFSTDVLRGLIAQVEKLSGVRYEGIEHPHAPAFHVIADHLRCLAFAIADGAQPSNVDRGYVLRKILRRAVRYARGLGLDKPFLATVLPTLVESMGEDYPELKTSQARAEEILTTEEEAFLRTLRRGGNMLNQVIEQANLHAHQISGDDAFKLKDTYGLPLEEITLLAKDAHLNVDIPRFEMLENEARERSRKVHKTTQQLAGTNLFAEFVQNHPPCEFLGYGTLKADSIVMALMKDGAFVDRLLPGEEGIIVLHQTPFYAEKGGQVADHGILSAKGGLFRVNDCQSPYKDVITHIGKLDWGELHVKDHVIAEVNATRRQKIANNHTATHLLHWALQKVLGEHIKQAGSVVDTARLRFDFNHHKSLTLEEIHQIEDLVNEKVRENTSVNAYELSFEEAQKRSDIKQFFGDKYGAVVRVIDIDFSKELCGGTHTASTGNIGYIRIVKEGSIAAGVRRIEAVSGSEAEVFAKESEHSLQQLADALKTQPGKLYERVSKLLEENKQLSHEVEASKGARLAELTQKLVKEAQKVGKASYIVAELPISSKELKICLEQTLAALGSAVVVLGCKEGERCSLAAAVSDDLIGNGFKANAILQEIAPIVQGTGGGKSHFAQAGGKDPDKIVAALSKAEELILTVFNSLEI